MPVENTLIRLTVSSSCQRAIDALFHWNEHWVTLDLFDKFCISRNSNDQCSQWTEVIQLLRIYRFTVMVEVDGHRTQAWSILYLLHSSNSSYGNQVHGMLQGFIKQLYITTCCAFNRMKWTWNMQSNKFATICRATNLESWTPYRANLEQYTCIPIDFGTDS